MDGSEMQDPDMSHDRAAEAPAEADSDGPPAAAAGIRRRLERPAGAILTVVDGGGHVDDDAQLLGELAAKLAAALRAVRGHVPDAIWWDTGAADALVEYQARRSR
jgi:hypothetical protein